MIHDSWYLEHSRTNPQAKQQQIFKFLRAGLPALQEAFLWILFALSPATSRSLDAAAIELIQDYGGDCDQVFAEPLGIFERGLRVLRRSTGFFLNGRVGLEVSKNMSFQMPFEDCFFFGGLCGISKVAEEVWYPFGPTKAGGNQ